MTRQPEQDVASTQSLDTLVDHVARIFTDRHGQQPDTIVAAPGRVNLIGEHIDYNDGFVLPMAIERYVVMAASQRRPETHGPTIVYSANLNQEISIPPQDSRPGSWACYLEGVMAGFHDLGISIPPFQAVLGSNVPLGGGLSSSAALEVAMATLLESITGVTLAAREKALLCQRAEHHYAGIPCGIMDQFSSVFGETGSLLKIDCRALTVDSVPFGGGGAVVLITDSKVKHSLADGAYAERRHTCEAALRKLGGTSWRDITAAHLNAEKHCLTPVEFRRARHVVSEIARTLEATTAIQESNWSLAGEYMYASHDSLRDDYEVSCNELDTLVDIARSLGSRAGVYGSRMTGGGFGGSTVTLVHPSQSSAVMEAMTARFEEKTGIRPAAFVTQPARGAHIVRVSG